jgi:CheY-like chemotaxis protein
MLSTNRGRGNQASNQPPGSVRKKWPKMKSPLHILYLEDDPNDAELVQQTLATNNITSLMTRVETEPDFIASLKQGGFDLIFADYTLPSFDGMSALKIAQRELPHLPFIFVSGTAACGPLPIPNSAQRFISRCRPKSRRSNDGFKVVQRWPRHYTRR